MKRILAFFLSLVIMLTTVPVSAFATDGTEKENNIIHYKSDDTQFTDEERFEVYAGQLFYGNSVSMFGNAAGEVLSADAKVLYDGLKPVIKQIAAGERASATISLGQQYTGPDGEMIPDTVLTVPPITAEMVYSVLDALMADMPYELYWYDKVAGCSIYTHGPTGVEQIVFAFTVAPKYRGADEYTADTSATGTATAAVANAQSIIDKYASASDYEKLKGYRDEICALVSYNHDAANANNFTTDIDPWQLIYVFDGNTGTNVVCEGYAKAFMYLCDMTDFSGDVACYTVTGAMDGGAHMWNIVTIDGENYLVDVTNSDDGTIGAGGGLFMAGGSGSVAAGYTVNGIMYIYDADTTGLWGAGDSSILNISSSDYEIVAPTPTPDDDDECYIYYVYYHPTMGTGHVVGDPHVKGQRVGVNVDTLCFVPGYGVVGWYYDEDFTQPVDKNDSFIINDDVYVYAKLVPGHHVIIEYYDGFIGESVTYDNLILQEGDKVPFPQIEVPEGYMISRDWRYSGSDWDNSYTGVWDFENDTVSFGMFLQGRLEKKCTVTFDVGGRCAAPEPVDLARGNTLLSLPECEAYGYRVTGWYTDPGYNKPFTLADRVYEDITLYAKWEKMYDAEHEVIGTGSCGENVIWTVYSNGELIISGNGNMTDYNSPELIPWYSYRNIIEKATVESGVTSLTSYAFLECKSLEKIKLLNESLSCGRQVFPDRYASTLIESAGPLGSGCDIEFAWNTAIPDYAFIGSSIKTITLPSTITSIGNYAFYSSDITEITIPGSVTYIGEQTLAYCPNLKEIAIENGVMSIPGYSIFNNPSLKKITIPESVEYIGFKNFDGCTSLEAIYYGGSPSQWEAIEKDFDEDNIKNATIHYAKEDIFNITVDKHTHGTVTVSKDVAKPGDKITITVEPYQCYKVDKVLVNGVEIDGFTFTAQKDSIVNVIFAENHIEIIENAIEPTCTETGLTEGKRCSVCGTVIVAQKTVAAKGHTEVIDKAVDPTCTKTGLTEGKHCSVCDTVLIAQKTVAAQGHKYRAEVTKPTCTETGYTTYTCTVCGDKYVDDETAALGHTEVVDKAVVPTYTSTGLTEGKHCSVCGEVVVKQEVIPALKEEKLAAPTATVKLNASGKPVISWNAVSGATKYEVYRSVNGGAYTRLILTAKNTVTHTGVTAGNTYSYKVRAVDANGKYSDYSSVLTVTIKAEEKLAAPTATVKLNASGKPVISWNAVSGASKYEVYRSVNGGAYARLILTAKNTVTHSGAVAGSTYSYKVRAVDANGKYSDYSSVLTVTINVENKLAAPTATVKLNASGKPVISWNKVNGATKYEVYRSVNGGAYARLILTAKNTVTHSGAVAGSTYSYKVRAVDANGKYSDYSSVLTVTINAENKLAAPTATVKLNASGKPVISWNAVSGASKYEVYRSVNGGEYARLILTGKTSVTHTGAVEGKTYSYKVRAVDANGKYSEYSTVVTVTLPDKLATPTATVKLNASGKPVISWNAVSGASKYEVHRSVNGGEYTRLILTAKNTVTHSGAVAGSTYSYKVRAVDANGKYSEYSTVITVTLPDKLATPTATVKLNASGKPVISWNAVSGASKYEVYRSVNGGAYARLILTGKTSVTHTGAVAGSTYSYKVRAVDANGKYSDYSSVLTVTIKAESKLAAPTATVKLNASGKPVISWNAVSGASKYEVHRSVNGGEYARLILTAKNTVTHSGAVAGSTYSYKVRAVDANGKYSDYSSVLTVTINAENKLAAPTATVKLNASGKPVISWNTVSGAAKYEVYRSVNGGAYARLILTAKNTVTHSGAVAGNTYSYKVRAVDANGKYSEYSTVVTAALDNKLAAPTLTVKLNASGKPVISWGAVDGADKYELSRATSENGTYKVLTTTTKLSVTNSVANGTYFYRVRAVKADGTKGAYSAVVSVRVG